MTMRLELADGPTIDVDDRREAMLRAALFCYRESCERYAVEARDRIARCRHERQRDEATRDARAWETIVKRIDALVEEMN